MKNLLIYINPAKSFYNPSQLEWKDEPQILVKIQIENSLALGWKKKDIMLVTNFPYEYKGVKAIEVGDENFQVTASKINTILALFDMGLIKKDELYWFHDFDAFQLEPIDEKELELDGYDLGITEYGITRISTRYNKKISTGIIFFNNKTRDIFQETKNQSCKYKVNEEAGLSSLLDRNTFNINGRTKRLDIRYNFAIRKRKLSENYAFATKPLKVIHFHPLDTRIVEDDSNNIDLCVYGKNRLNKVLVSKKLIRLFKKHGII